MDGKLYITQAFPRICAFFSLGVEEVVSRLRSVGYEEQIIFVEFEPANIDYILLSDFEFLAKKNKEKNCTYIFQAITAVGSLVWCDVQHADIRL